jgi:hypothetical protein
MIRRLFRIISFITVSGFFAIIRFARRVNARKDMPIARLILPLANVSFISRCVWAVL